MNTGSIRSSQTGRCPDGLVERKCRLVEVLILKPVVIC